MPQTITQLEVIENTLELEEIANVVELTNYDISESSLLQLNVDDTEKNVNLEEITNIIQLYEPSNGTSNVIQVTDYEVDILVMSEQGPPGKSAYELALDAGFVGDKTAWLESLKPPPSRYDITLYAQGLLSLGETLYELINAVSFRFSANFAGSQGRAESPSTERTTILFKKNDVVFGSLIFEIGSLVGVFESPLMHFDVGDKFTISVDDQTSTNLSGLALTLAAIR